MGGVGLRAKNVTAVMIAEDSFVYPAPGWLVDSGLLDEYDGEEIEFSFSGPERSVFKKPLFEDIVKWLPKNFILTQGESKGQLFSFEKTPHLKDLMWAITQACVQEFYYAGASQGAMKSTLAFGCGAWFDVFAPKDFLHCYPTQALAERNNLERLQKIYSDPAAPKVLRKLRTGNKNDETKEFLRLTASKHYFGYAGSDDTVRDISVGGLHIDETDSSKFSGQKKKTNSGRTKTVVNYFVPQARKRVRSYSQYKAIFCSSVSHHEGFIWIGVTKEVGMLFWYWVRCPYCMTWQPMRWSEERFVVKAKGDGSEPDWREIIQYRLGRYRCVNDGCHPGGEPGWTDQDRDKAVRLGGWFRFEGDPEDDKNFKERGEGLRLCIKKYRPKKIGAIFPAWMCALGTPSFSLSETIALYHKSRDEKLPLMDRISAEEDFQKDHCSFPFRMVVARRPLAEAQALIGDLPEGIVPGNGQVCALVAGVDTQDKEFFLTVWAVGYGINPDMWMIYRRQVNSKEELTKELCREFYTADKEYVYSGLHGNFFGGIDYLGHRSKEVWDYCCTLRANFLLVPVHGSNRPMNVNLRAERRETWPGSTQPLPKWMQLESLRINGKYYKDYLYNKSIQPPGSSGQIRFHKMDDNDYFLHHWVAESRGKDGFWINEKQKAEHCWDASYIAACVADYMGLKTIKNPMEE